MRKLLNRMLAIGIAASLALSTAASVLASSVEGDSINGGGKVEVSQDDGVEMMKLSDSTVTEVKIGSEVWSTPIIPSVPDVLTGVKQSEISLNETTGDGTWKYLFDIPDYTQAGGIPAPTETDQDFDFSEYCGLRGVGQRPGCLSQREAGGISYQEGVFSGSSGGRSRICAGRNTAYSREKLV